MLKKKFLKISKTIIDYHLFITFKCASSKRVLRKNDVNKLLGFFPFVKNWQCPASLREIFFNALLSILIINNSDGLQNKVSKNIPFLLKSLMATRKLSRVHSIIWKVIHLLVLKNKSNLIIFRQNNGLHLIQKYLNICHKNSTARAREIVKCAKSLKRQLSKINDCITIAAISEARMKLKKGQKLFRNHVNSQPIRASLEKGVSCIFLKTFLSTLPKIFWAK